MPVLHVLEEWGMTPSEPNVSENYRLWEVAGAAHADYWILRQQFDAPERAAPQQPQNSRAWAMLSTRSPATTATTSNRGRRRAWGAGPCSDDDEAGPFCFSSL